MTINRRREITIETHEITLIRKSKSATDRCRTCGTAVPCFTAEQAAVISRSTLMEVCRRLETGEIHLTNPGRAAAIVCGRSLHEPDGHSNQNG
ncbi:MAG: hypothetical protein WKF92_11595 [Pyrinomonadaceae bacterium]